MVASFYNICERIAEFCDAEIPVTVSKLTIDISVPDDTVCG
jgi:hypothetical protein